MKRGGAPRRIEIECLLRLAENVDPHGVLIAGNINAADRVLARPVMIDPIPERLRKSMQVVTDSDLPNLVFLSAPGFEIVHVPAKNSRDRRMRKNGPGSQSWCEACGRCWDVRDIHYRPIEKFHRSLTEGSHLEFNSWAWPLTTSSRAFASFRAAASCCVRWRPSRCCCCTRGRRPKTGSAISRFFP